MRDYIKMFTHNGLFHADDVFAAAMLSLMCDDYEVVRGGDEEIPSNEDGSWIVFDIGGGELDHHTPECLEANGTHPGTEVPYAACGLVWKKFYPEILEALDCPQPFVERVYRRIESSLVLGIDAADNGFDPVKNVLESMNNVTDDQKKEIISASQIPYSISKMIADFNPSWESDRPYDEAFLDAMSFAKDVLLNRIDSAIDSLDGRDFILRHIDYSAGHLLILEKFAPWQGIVTSESRNNPKAKDLWYVISPALRGGWNIQCVLEDPDDRTSYRHPLPESWHGLRGEEFAKVCGVADAKFCHPGGFIAGADSQSGALSLASKAME